MEVQNKFLTVSQLNEYVKMLMESNPVLRNVWIKGELSNFKNHYSTGHFYFSLKDDNAIVRGVMFRSYAQNVQFVPRDGMKVLVHGRVSAFVRDGQYQIYVDEILPDGVGSLYLAFEQLKRRLGEQGLFDEARKKPLPRYPERIGIVTSPTGAAIQDMMNVLGRRFPCAAITLYPALVQGPDAAPQLIRGIEYFNGTRSADVIIIGRGGGSMEDLWAFNDERLALCIAASEIPVISAVGHESDFTICDFVADKRAPTPSAAAELAVPDRAELHVALSGVGSKLERILLNKIQNSKNSLKYLRDAGVFSGPASIVNERRMGLLFTARTMDSAMGGLLQKDKAALAAMTAKVETLSPLSVLSRGYGVIQDAEGVSVRGVANVKAGDEISIRVRDGRINATVKSTHKERKTHGKNSENL